MTLLADIFNLFDQQIVQNYDTFTSLTFGGGPNPNFGQPTSQILAGPQIQAPRQITRRALLVLRRGAPRSSYTRARGSSGSRARVAHRLAGQDFLEAIS